MSGGIKKKLIALFLLACFNMPSVSVYAETIRGGIEKGGEAPAQENIFTGETHKIETRDVINMTVSQVISGAYSEEGDEFFAEVTQDVEANGGIALPAGTIAHGTIRALEDAKRLGRDAWIEMEFDYLVTPDGREIPINAKMTSKKNPIVGGTQTIAKNVGYTATGGLIGGFAALQVLGAEAAVASQGYTLLGGAALGGVIGLGLSLFRKGNDVLLSPGDEIKVKIATDLELPIISEEALKQDEIKFEGLDVRFTNISIEEDPFGEKNTYAISMAIVNSTNKIFTSFDIGLVDDLNGVFYPSIFGDSSLMFKQINSGDRIAGKLCFSVNDTKRKHWLVFYDRSTRKPIAKLSIDNAKKEIKNKKEEKKSKKRKNKKRKN